MKHYLITRREEDDEQSGDVCCTVRDTLSGEEYQLTPEASLRVVNHSPTGFEFGYGGSGPAQLALAILLDILNTEPENELAIHLHQRFKVKFIAPQDGDFFGLFEDDIRKWIRICIAAES